VYSCTVGGVVGGKFGSVGWLLATLGDVGADLSVALATLGRAGAAVVRNIVASWWSAASRSLPDLANGAAGVGFRSASMRLIADLTTVSVEDKRGMGH
jgi:hypothetical protein